MKINNTTYDGLDPISQRYHVAVDEKHTNADKSLNRSYSFFFLTLIFYWLAFGFFWYYDEPVIAVVFVGLSAVSLYLYVSFLGQFHQSLKTAKSLLTEWKQYIRDTYNIG